VKKLRVTSDAMQEEMKLLATALQKARKGNIPTDSEPALPIALKGKILAVDPKYDFVVLDIGAAQGVEERGALLVNRNSKLIAKVKVARVQQNRCIANIVADWKFDTVLEGDQVIVQ